MNLIEPKFKELFSKLKSKHTFKEMERLTGLNKTRLFRISVDSSPTLSELDKFISSGLITMSELNGW